MPQHFITRKTKQKRVGLYCRFWLFDASSCRRRRNIDMVTYRFTMMSHVDIAGLITPQESRGIETMHQIVEKF